MRLLKNNFNTTQIKKTKTLRKVNGTTTYARYIVYGLLHHYAYKIIYIYTNSLSDIII